MGEGSVWDAVEAAQAAAEQGDEGAAWEALEPLLESWRDDWQPAQALAVALGTDGLDRERRLALAAEVLEAYPDELRVLAPLGEATELLIDRRYLNAPPPDQPFFRALLARLELAFAAEPALDSRIGEALASTARACGRAGDAACDAAHRYLLRHQPSRWQTHYNHGLFLKTRGRFDEGLRANQRAAELGGADEDSVIWNLGICATGAGEGALALDLWRKKLGAKLRLGADGLPEGGFHAVQVRLAERPLAARGPDQDEPGLEETIWVERLSPCHGRVRSALFYELGVDYGDLVLFDGAPILTREFDGRKVDVFPHLVTLRRGGWRVFPFAGTQERAGQLAELPLPGEALLYSHTERVTHLCQQCWERADQSRTHHHAETEHLVVRGKLCIPSAASLVAVDHALREQLRLHPGARLFVPRLAEALGDAPRAAAEARQLARLADDAAR